MKNKQQCELATSYAVMVYLYIYKCSTKSTGRNASYERRMYEQEREK